jgi:putative phosphoesterase
VKSVCEIGLISDTHGLLRPEAIVELEGCDVILHAGDVGGSLIIDTLTQFAHTFAVGGNCDVEETFPDYFIGEYGGKKLLMFHGHLPIDENEFKPDIVITGHSHIPLIEQDKSILRINPGSAGPKRFKLPVTVARLTISSGIPVARIINLNV